ncbi:MAG: ester cyclase, partial [Boseongicola sp.]
MISADEMTARANAYAKAWSSGDPDGVASFYAEDGEFEINGGDPMNGRAAIAEMASGFYAEFPDLVVHLDDFRLAGQNAVFAWTLEGHHSETKNYVKVPGWEEWELTEDGFVAVGRGRFDAAEYDRQVA